LRSTFGSFFGSSFRSFLRSSFRSFLGSSFGLFFGRRWNRCGDWCSYRLFGKQLALRTQFTTWTVLASFTLDVAIRIRTIRAWSERWWNDRRPRRLGDFVMGLTSDLVVRCASGLVVGALGRFRSRDKLVIMLFKLLHLLAVQLQRRSHALFLVCILYIPWFAIAIVVKSHVKANIPRGNTSILKVNI